MTIISCCCQTGEMTETECTPTDLGVTTEAIFSDVKKKIQNYSDSLFGAGFSYQGVVYQIDENSQNRIHKRFSYASNSVIDPVAFPWVDPYSKGWRCVNNDWHVMTAQEFFLFGKLVSDYCSKIIACCFDHKNAITIENCATYDYTTGWPVNP